MHLGIGHPAPTVLAEREAPTASRHSSLTDKELLVSNLPLPWTAGLCPAPGFGDGLPVSVESVSLIDLTLLGTRPRVLGDLPCSPSPLAFRRPGRLRRILQNVAINT